MIWKILYKTSSGLNSGTLHQLRNLLKRRSVTAKVKSDPTACEEFFLLVIEGHIMSLVMEEFDIDSVEGTPKLALFSEENFLTKNMSKRKEIFMNAMKQVVKKYVYCFGLDKTPASTETDKVLLYSTTTLSLGLLYMEYCDGIREGDGYRILHCWRYMLMLFKAKNRTKYSIQAA